MTDNGLGDLMKYANLTGVGMIAVAFVVLLIFTLKRFSKVEDRLLQLQCVDSKQQDQIDSHGGQLAAIIQTATPTTLNISTPKE